MSSEDYRQGYDDGLAEAERTFQAIMARASLAIHPRPMPYRCKRCDAAFHTGKQLGWHMAHVHPKAKRKARRARCKLCGEVFKNAITVRHHMNREHT